MIVTAGPWLTDPPGPDGARSISELGTRLRALQAWTGLSVREIHRRVNQQRRLRGVAELPALDTVHRCLKPGRVRLDQDLVVDIACALLGDDLRAADWRQAHRMVTERAATGAAVAVRQGLPELLSGFVGRRKELESLLKEAAEAAVVVVHGMAGAGKTTFALHAAHQLINHGRFTDLQLSVSLHGDDVERAPADPGVVLDGMLRQLGCSVHEIYDLDLDGRTALLRQRLAGKRALILLDGVADASQVAPLLPGGQTCLTLITSRRQLAELNPLHIPLAPFIPDESQELLSNVIGTARLANEPAAAAGIADAVGHLPLALALVAGKILRTPDWTLLDHQTRLAERRAHLSLDKAVTVALDASYVALPPSRQRLLRLAAIHPGLDIDGYAAAALAGVELAAAAGDLAALANESMLVRRANGRFEMHDLIRLFAADRASDVDAPQARAEALTRLFEYYRFVAYRAARLHEPHYVRTMQLREPATAWPALEDRRAAITWLEAERPNLLACALHHAGHDKPDYTSDLASLLHHYLYTIGHLHDAEQLDRHASLVSHGVDRARALGRLGSVCSWLGRLDEAREHYQAALAVLEVDGDHSLRARCLTNYGMLWRRLGRFDEAISCHQQARALFLDCGEQALAAQQLGNLGQLYVLTGQHTNGVASLCQALAVAKLTADRIGEADALGNLGVAALVAGQPQEAFNRHNQALRIFIELGDRAGEGAARNGCGTALAALGEPERAMEQHRLALAIAKEIGDREGEAEALLEGGRTLHRLAKFEDALDWHVSALWLSERTGNTWQQTRAHDEIACSGDAIGDPELAQAHWRRALSLHAGMGTVDVDRIVAKLAAAKRPAPAP